MTAGESDFATDPGPGTIDCQGTFDGQQITGTGTYAVVGRILAGPAGTATCPQGGGFGTQTFTIPSTDGSVTISEQFTFTWVGAAGRFEGQTLSGAFEFTPVQGDCVSTPLTQVAVRGEALLGERAAG